jgi:hypothetical protein
MVGWFLVAAVLGVGLTVGTIAWWRIGDQWADSEHKKFHAKEPKGPAPTVIRFDEKPDGSSADR